MKHMYIYASTSVNCSGNKTPLCVESNLEFAIAYWTKRKQVNPEIHWVIK